MCAAPRVRSPTSWRRDPSTERAGSAAALRAWVSREHADALQSHLDKGRLVLWFELAQPQDLDVVCGRLVQTSPHVVGMCSMASRA